MDNQTVNEAIEILLNNFTRHPAFASSQSHDGKIDVFDALQEFWQMKYEQELGSEVNIVYEFVEKPGPPYVCFVTLPGGACFATFQNATTKLEARKSGALISLMNSVFNEHPLRKINDDFIKKTVDHAQKDFPNICPLSLQLYKRMLEMCLNKSMLEFKQMMTVFQLLQWNGSLKAMRERNCKLDEVIEFYKNFKIDEDMRSQMSIDWISKEQEQQSTIMRELQKVNGEIEVARLNGQELRFLKEKRDILLQASYQLDMEINSIS